MSKVRDTVHFNVRYSTEDKTYGPVYVASGVELAIVTDGQSFETLVENIREALALHLESIDTVAEFNMTANPRIVAYAARD